MINTMDKKLISAIISIPFLLWLGLLIIPSFINNIPIHVVYIKVVMIILFIMGYLTLRTKYKLSQVTDIIISCLILLLIGIYFNYRVTDDAYISLRYAANFAKGHGLVFNIGEKVEGYTCFLWVFLLGIHAKLAIDIVFMAKILGIGFGIATIILVYNLMNLIYEEDNNKLTSGNYLILLGVHLPLVFWSFSGMETTFYIFLLLCSIYFMVKIITNKNNSNLLTNVKWSSMFFSFAAMTRPETYALMPINLLFVSICTPAEKRLKSVLSYLFVFLAIFGPFFMWRYNYYGFMFPNTFYAKVDYSSLLLMKKGILYLLNGFIPHLIILLFILVSILKRWQFYKAEEVYLFSILITQCLAVIYTGADHFSRELRYFVYMMPILLILSWPGFVSVINSLSNFILNRFQFKVIEKDNIKIVIGNAIICFMCIFSLCFSRDIWWLGSAYIYTPKWANVGKWLKIYAKPTDTLATPAIGAMAFYSGLKTYDMLGLTDKVIAHKKVDMGKGVKDHEKFDINYILNKKPTYIFLGTFKEEDLKKDWNWLGEKGVYKQLYKSNLLQDYTLLSVFFNGTDFTFYKRHKGALQN